MKDHTHDTPESSEALEEGGELRPDQVEPNGPLAGLIHASSVELAGKVSDDPDIGAEAEIQAINEGIGVQEEGVEASELFGMMLATVLSIATLVFALYYLFFVTQRDEARNVAEDVPLGRYVEQRELRAEAQDAYAHYSIIPNAEDRYRIPIDAAMTIVARSTTGGAAVPESRAAYNLAWMSLHPAPAVYGGMPGEALPNALDSTLATPSQIGPEPLEEPEASPEEAQ